ncbi:uncharacterized protein [Fopius arisanus]|uniref:Chitin-binding type-2 domain-containing protein n=2 Tax=Fopius arisanus TaxID=64838 RepID=A0A9R1U0H1_9HYME|nr:PREDICTED: uncharacterized protein LOC105266554 [Fopius arisanus]
MSRIYSSYFFFILAVLLTRWTTLASSNTTTELDDDDDDLDMDFETFKSTIKRYRRLIPYISHYVASNHVNQGNQHDPSTGLNSHRLMHGPQSQRSPGHITALVNQEKFVPSVQYDPKDIGGDNDYFTPVRYNKPSYEEYYRDYDRRPVYQTDITSHNHQDTRYYNQDRPRPQTNPYHHNQKHKISNIYRDYFLDYQRPVSIQTNQDYYPVDDFESLKYVKIEPPRTYKQQHQSQSPRVQSHLQRRPIYQSNNINRPIANENIIKSLQLTNQLPEILNRDNIDASLKTLAEILSLLRDSKKSEIEHSHLSEPVVTQNVQSYSDTKHHYRPKVVTETRYQATPSPLVDTGHVNLNSQVYRNNGKSKLSGYSDYGIKSENFIEYYQPVVQDIDDNGDAHDYDTRPYKIDDEQDYDTRSYDIETKPYKVPTADSSYGISENVDEGEDKQVATTPQAPKHFQLAEGFISDALNIPTMAIKYGATRGKPGIDYPAYAVIPETNFNCKEQRYKGFFGDPSTRCQVWHYCDLNGGKSSFLCPNGTIFSQQALTCDWWFNVKCESTTQLYVLNERLYKFILPIMPKFPEDFSGPEVDRYLEMKFREMEAKMKAKKLKKAMEKKKQEKTTTSTVE